MTSINTLGENVKKFRKEQGMTMQEFATKCGLSLPYMLAIEKGGREVSTDRVAVLATNLGKTTDELCASAD